MGIDMLDIGYRVEKKFSLKRFRPLPSTAASHWTAGDLFEQVWHALQGEEPDWELNEKWWGVWRQGHELRQAAKGMLATFHQGWQIFMPNDLNRLISSSQRLDVWNRLETIYGLTLPPLEPPSQGEIMFPPQCQTPSALIDLFERTWAEGRLPQYDQWRPSQYPPPTNAGQWTRVTAWQAFAEILSHCLGVTLEEITPESTLVGDLGLS